MKTRRDFLKISATGVAGAAGFALTSNVQSALGATVPLAAGPGNTWPGRVVINFNKAAVTGDVTPVPSVIASMVNDSILRLTGKATLADAWRALFPSTLTTPPKIAIKVPAGFATAGPPATAPHWASIKAITDGLQLMVFGTTKLPAANITIYDFSGTSGAFATFDYNATNFPGITLVEMAGWQHGFCVPATPPGAQNLPVAQSLVNADYLINVFSPRSHEAWAGGVTLGFKNHYGTYDPMPGTPNAPNPHDATIGPKRLRDFNCTATVLAKNVLSVCSGIFGTHENGEPGDAAISYYTYAKTMDSSITDTNQSPTTIMMSTDPVSIEFEAIKMMRLNDGGKYTPADMPNWLQASAGITGAMADATYNIGIIDESAMDIRRILNGVTATALQTEWEARPDGAQVQASPIRGSNSTFIEYAVPENHAGNSATISIFDAKGTLVRSFSQRIGGAVNHLSWDETDMNGRPVARGLYVARLHSGTVNASAPFTVTRR